MFRSRVSAFLTRLVCIGIGFALFGASAIADPVAVELPAQPLASALREFARQTGIQVAVPAELTDGKTSSAVKGSFEPIDALNKILKGSGLSAYSVNRNTFGIRRETAAAKSQDSVNRPTTSNAASIDAPVRVAQTPAAADATPLNPNKSVAARRLGDQADLAELVVTGTRLKVAENESAQVVQIYGRDAIDSTGMSSVADFLNTIPDVSVGANEQYFGNNLSGSTAATSVQLHGMPVGTTLVLINGRRVETGGTLSTSDAFDLNTIPLSAVQRIEVLPAGASSIYGSDAIAGVVNVILKTDFSGVEADAKYSWAKDLPEWDASFAAGKKWDRGGVTLIGTFLNRGSLNGFDRSFASSSDFAQSGGSDYRFPTCNPGNVYFPNGYTINGKSVNYAGVPSGYAGKPTVQEFAGTAGVQNQCSIFPYSSIVPASRREGAFLSGHFDVTDSVELFAEVLYSHVTQSLSDFPADLYQTPVPATNAYNPFGQTVNVSYLFSTLPYNLHSNTTLFRPVAGVRGALWGDWTWEFSALSSRDHEGTVVSNSNSSAQLTAALGSSNPATALNLFGSGLPARQGLLNTLFSPSYAYGDGQLISGTLFARGTLAQLPAGPIAAAIGAEYNRNEYDSVQPGNTPYASYGRQNYAVFSELNLPIVGKLGAGSTQNYLTATVAGRYDHYSDFGGKATPDFGVIWNPLSTLSLRGNYAQSFKAPTLIELDAPRATYSDVYALSFYGQGQPITLITGGNPNLKAETAVSHTLNLTYRSNALSGLEISLTNWAIHLKNDIQTLSAQAIADNPSLFSQYITGTPSGGITGVTEVPVNFGDIKAAGLDYSMKYRIESAAGTWVPTLAATQVYQFTSALQPGAPVVNIDAIAQDSRVWSPRWKGTAALSWSLSGLSLTFDGRYVGKYQEYDLPEPVGNFWLFDFNARYTLRDGDGRFGHSFVTAGVRNIINKEPQFANFSVIGYDPSQSDPIGRTAYLGVGIRY